MSYMDKHLNNMYQRISNLENKLGGVYQVLEQIVGKELLRMQALHKVLQDKAIFTDQELKIALDALIAESKADLKKMEEDAKNAKAKAVELLVPVSANLTPPVEEDPVPGPGTGGNEPPTNGG